MTSSRETRAVLCPHGAVVQNECWRDTKKQKKKKQNIRVSVLTASDQVRACWRLAEDGRRCVWIVMIDERRWHDGSRGSRDDSADRRRSDARAHRWWRVDVFSVLLSCTGRGGGGERLGVAQRATDGLVRPRTTVLLRRAVLRDGRRDPTAPAQQQWAITTTNRRRDKTAASGGTRRHGRPRSRRGKTTAAVPTARGCACAPPRQVRSPPLPVAPVFTALVRVRAPFEFAYFAPPLAADVDRPWAPPDPATNPPPSPPARRCRRRGPFSRHTKILPEPGDDGFALQGTQSRLGWIRPFSRSVRERQGSRPRRLFACLLGTDELKSLEGQCSKL